MKEPECPKNGPYNAMLNAGDKVFWCACGRSKGQPYCDGSHKGTEFLPVKLDIEESGYVRLCGCKKTKNPPYCDGSHFD